MTTTTLRAPDIECEGCASSIRRALARTPGVADVKVDIAEKTVTVSHDVAVETVNAALERAGFPAE